MHAMTAESSTIDQRTNALSASSLRAFVALLWANLQTAIVILRAQLRAICADGTR
jgi:hypothetical protein